MAETTKTVEELDDELVALTDERVNLKARKHEVAFAYEPYRATSDELRFLHNPRLTFHASISDSDLV